ncbi:MAG TPA: hypothetical protein VLE73_05965 [Candidatus Saccharimonadales bacterium]|nr:hypothetical protein [Candidatus Saccharimonadales bacterium]
MTTESANNCAYFNLIAEQAINPGKLSTDTIRDCAKCAGWVTLREGRLSGTLIPAPCTAEGELIGSERCPEVAGAIHDVEAGERRLLDALRNRDQENDH